MNWQNIPRDDKLIKAAVLPKLDGLLEADYAQIEPRLLAYYMSRCGDDSLAELYRVGADVYRIMAAGVYGCPPEDVTPKQRQDTKRLFLSLMYGGGSRTVMAQGHTQAEAKRLIRAFYDANPGIRLVSNPKPKDYPYQSFRWEPGAIERRLEERGFIETIAGRPLRPEPFREHIMLNKLIQGSAAEIMKRALVRVHRWLSSTCESHIILTVHDSMVLDVRESELAFIGELLPGIMCEEPEITERVPLAVELEWSTTTWAEKKPWGNAVQV